MVRRLVSLWAYTLRRAEDDVVMRLSSDNPTERERQLAAFGALIGDDRPGPLLKILRDAGFIDVARDGALVVHDWYDWQDQPPRARTRPTPGNYSSSNTYGITTGSGRNTGRSTGTTTYGSSTGSSSLYENDMEGECAGKEGGSGEGKPNTRNTFGTWQWWLVEGFNWRGYRRVLATRDGAYFKSLDRIPETDIALSAELYIAISEGRYGDDFDVRSLSARYVIAKLGAFSAFKRRRQIRDTLIPLTPAGRERYEAIGCGVSGMADQHAGETADRNGATDPAATSGNAGGDRYQPKQFRDNPGRDRGETSERRWF